MTKIIPIFVPHQGCPQRCIYCHQPHITGVPIHTSLTVEEVRQTIETALREPKSRRKGAQFEVAFYGGTFTGLERDVQAQLLGLAQVYVERGEVVGIRLSTHPKMIDAQTLDILSAFHVTTVELGVQSFDDAVLAQAQRGYTAEEVHTVVRQLQQRGIRVGLHLMIGLPGDSHETSIWSAQQAIALQPASVRLHPTLVIRNTRLATLYRQGAYVPLSLETAVHTCKTMLQLFRAQQIPVIRIGLQPTKSLEQHLIAGPYHPAFRQLVESAVWHDQIVHHCAEQRVDGHNLTIWVAPAELSTVRGQKNSNLLALQSRLHLSMLRILPADDLQPGAFRLDDGNHKDIF